MDGLLEIAKGIIHSYGYAGIFALTTLDQFIFPIPSDVFIAIGNASKLNFTLIMMMVVPATLIGDVIGYFLGKKLGHPVVLWLFGQKRIDHAEHLIKKWGLWGIVIAGYAPFPFKVITWSAGIFEYPLSKYILGVCLGHLPRYFLFGLLTSVVIKTQFYATPEMSAILLGAMQGLTEFLPISSSGHLALMERFVKLPFSATSQSMEAFDIFLHAGSLLAIVLYFWRDAIEVLKGVFDAIVKRNWTTNLFVKLALGTLPAIVAGLFLNNVLTGPALSGMTGIGISFIIGGLFYLFAEWKGGKAEGETVTLKKSVLMGIAQAIAIAPSLSRSGLTIGTGLLLGIKRETAAKFSFLLGGVAILAANVYTLFSLRHGTAPWPDLTFSLIGISVSFVVSLGAIHWMLKFLHKHSLRPFAFYVILLGTLILTLL